MGANVSSEEKQLQASLLLLSADLPQQQQQQQWRCVAVSLLQHFAKEAPCSWYVLLLRHMLPSVLLGLLQLLLLLLLILLLLHRGSWPPLLWGAAGRT